MRTVATLILRAARRIANPFACASRAATPRDVGKFYGGRFRGLFMRTARWNDGVRRVLGVTVLAFVASIALISGGIIIQSAEGTEAIASSALRSLIQAQQWLNTPGLHAEDLRGKVVLVNFWTYSCINSLRVLPYLRTWAVKYRDQGLMVVGVHTPEFGFERDLANVGKALVALGVNYPIIIDNEYRIWDSYNNDAWPGLYFIGVDGRIRHLMLGEGEYDESERVIQKLLSEVHRPSPGSNSAQTSIEVSGVEAAPDFADERSPETYIGDAKAENFVSPDPVTRDVSQAYRSAPSLSLNSWGLSGRWTVGREFATLDQPSGRIRFHFHARDLHLVLRPSDDGKPIRFRVTIDDASPGDDHGTDIDAQGMGTVQDARLYQLVRQKGAVKDRTFEIEFLDPGVHAYVFTFG